MNSSNNITSKPDLPARLLWEYDMDTFNWMKSYKIVIERVLQMGDLNEWRAMIKYYSRTQILETIKWSAQLNKRDKDFALLFINSDLVNAQQES